MWKQNIIFSVLIGLGFAFSQALFFQLDLFFTRSIREGNIEPGAFWSAAILFTITAILTATGEVLLVDESPESIKAQSKKANYARGIYHFLLGVNTSFMVSFFSFAMGG